MDQEVDQLNDMLEGGTMVETNAALTKHPPPSYQVAVKMVDLTPQMARLRFDDNEPILEIADPPYGEPMQWIVIRGRDGILGLSQAIQDFMLSFPRPEEDLKID